jgi:hypothetical protein
MRIDRAIQGFGQGRIASSGAVGNASWREPFLGRHITGFPLHVVNPDKFIMGEMIMSLQTPKFLKNSGLNVHFLDAHRPVGVDLQAGWR